MKSDLTLKKEILVRLELARELDATALRISVEDGIVTLRGELESGEKRRAAERAVKLTPGVRGLVDRIQVAHRELNVPEDSEIAERVTAAIRWLTTIPADSVEVSVRDGWVSLRGVVAVPHQRQTLEDVIRALPEVRGLENLVELQAEPLHAHELSLTA